MLHKCLKFFMAESGKERYLLLLNRVPVLEAQGFCVQLVNVQCL